MKLAKGTIKLIKAAFVLSFLYNIIGLGFAVSAQLSPIVCAILMPLSSVTIVVFVTAGVHLLARKLDEKHSVAPLRKQKRESLLRKAA